MFRSNGVASATSAAQGVVGDAIEDARRRGGADGRDEHEQRQPEDRRAALAEPADGEDERCHAYSSPDRSTVVIPARRTCRVTIATVTRNRTSAAP